MIIIVCGPTASGKSALGVSLAQELNGEVVNIDSVQLYQDLIIGAATISTEEMQGIPHHLFGVVSPHEPFDVARYLNLANQCIEEIHGKGKVPIFVGGASLYVTSLLYGLAPLPKADTFLREELEKLSSDELKRRLEEIDPTSSSQISTNDRVRLIRAIEASASSPVSLKREAHGFSEPLFHACIVVPTWEREVLYRRIEARAQSMVENGLIEEVRGLLEKYGKGASAIRSIGYEETVRYLEGKLPIEALSETIAQNTRRFAKRQMTWLRNQPAKRGWSIKPNDRDKSISLEGDLTRFPKAGRVKNFVAWDITHQQLCDYLSEEDNNEQKAIEISFLNAKRLFSVD